MEKQNRLVIEDFDETDLKNMLYAEIIQIVQPLEGKGKYKGNSHHLAQEIVEKVSSAIWKKNTA